MKEKIIPVAIPWLDDEEAEASSRVIRSGWVTQGPEVNAFEREFSHWTESPFCCAVSSCTTALHIALMALKIGPGDEVITVSHSFIATASSIRYTGAIPRFVDIRPDTFNINVDLIPQVINKRTKAILCVHQMGMPCDIKQLIEISKSYKLHLIEDAACAVGSEININGKWEKIGRPHGDVCCFSFHPRKVITTGDGGMLCTSDPELDRQFRLLRQHGMSVPDTLRHNARQVIFETYPIMGYNYRLTDIQAAIGRVQLKRLPEIISRRRCIAKRYSQLLQVNNQLQSPTEPPHVKSNWQSYCVRLLNNVDQKSVMQKMLDNGVATRRGIMNAHLEAPYLVNVSPGLILTESEAAQNHCIILPIYPQLTPDQQDRIVQLLFNAISDSTMRHP